MKNLFGMDFLESQVFGEEPLPEEDEDNPAEEAVELELVLEDGSRLTCRVAGVFMEGEKEYIALETDGHTIQIMGLGEGEDGEISLIPLSDKEEQERSLNAFFCMFSEEPEQAEEIKREKEERGIENDRDQDREEN